MIIPIGVDCGVAGFCKKHNLRAFAFPFDWTVTYNGVAKCIEDDFKSFIPPLNERINAYDMYFFHDFIGNAFEQDKQKYIRRYERLMEILRASETSVIFCRKGHDEHHHREHNGRYSKITNDIDDAENLFRVLKSKYPFLIFRIIVILVCGKCFNPNHIYMSEIDQIEIHNNVGVGDYENCMSHIFEC